jgi:hypothetical protein
MLRLIRRIPLFRSLPAVATVVDSSALRDLTPTAHCGRLCKNYYSSPDRDGVPVPISCHRPFLYHLAVQIQYPSGVCIPPPRRKGPPPLPNLSPRVGWASLSSPQSVPPPLQGGSSPSGGGAGATPATVRGVCRSGIQWPVPWDQSCVAASCAKVIWRLHAPFRTLLIFFPCARLIIGTTPLTLRTDQRPRRVHRGHGLCFPPASWPRNHRPTMPAPSVTLPPR